MFLSCYVSHDLIEPPTASLKGKHEKRGEILSASAEALNILNAVGSRSSVNMAVSIFYACVISVQNNSNFSTSTNVFLN